MRYDAIVAGAGSAGAIVAARLSEEPHRAVLLLEAGPDYPGLDSLPPQAAFHAACLAAGFPDCSDHNAPSVSGVGPTPMNTLDGIRWGTHLAYVDRARHRLNLTIRPRCYAQRVAFEGRRATGLEVRSGHEVFTVHGDEIVLSAGAIGSPHLLLLSGVGPAEQLRAHGLTVQADLPGVGQNLRDHPHVYATWRPAFGYPMNPDRQRCQTLLRYTAPGSELRIAELILEGS